MKKLLKIPVTGPFFRAQRTYVFLSIWLTPFLSRLFYIDNLSLNLHCSIHKTTCFQICQLRVLKKNLKKSQNRVVKKTLSIWT